MKKITLSFLFVLSALFLVAQEKDSIPREDVPFAIIEQVPIYPGCEKLDKNLQKLCFQNQIKKHIAINYNYKIADTLGLATGIAKVYVQFKIDKNGFVKDVRARGAHKALEREGIRVIKNLPKMIPAMSFGKKIGVKYTLPVNVWVNKPKRKKKRRKRS